MVMASAAAVASSSKEELDMGMPVRSHTMVWKFNNDSNLQKGKHRKCEPRGALPDMENALSNEIHQLYIPGWCNAASSDTRCLTCPEQSLPGMGCIGCTIQGSPADCGQ